MTLSPAAKAHRDEGSAQASISPRDKFDIFKLAWTDGYEFARKEIFEATHPLIKDAKLYHEKSLSGWIELESRITTKPQPEGE